jgi:hypothetical protein
MKATVSLDITPWAFEYFYGLSEERPATIFREEEQSAIPNSR